MVFQNRGIFDFRDATGELVKNFTSSQKALATTVFVDFHLPPSIF
jgi:hypothetical protein